MSSEQRTQADKRQTCCFTLNALTICIWHHLANVNCSATNTCGRYRRVGLCGKRQPHTHTWTNIWLSLISREPVIIRSPKTSCCILRCWTKPLSDVDSWHLTHFHQRSNATPVNWTCALWTRLDYSREHRESKLATRQCSKSHAVKSSSKYLSRSKNRKSKLTNCNWP